MRPATNWIAKEMEEEGYTKVRLDGVKEERLSYHSIEKTVQAQTFSYDVRQPVNVYSHHALEAHNTRRLLSDRQGR